MSAEIAYYKPVIVCISETWLMPVDALNVYNLEGYISYFNNRQSKRGGGTMVLVNKCLVSRQLLAAVTTNDAFNVCAVAIGRGNKQLLVVAVYRAPWATSVDTKELCKVLDSVVVKHVNVVIVGDFNLPISSVNSTWIPKELNSFAEHHSMIQIAREATREDVLLDLIFTTSHFAIIVSLTPCLQWGALTMLRSSYNCAPPLKIRLPLCGR